MKREWIKVRNGLLDPKHIKRLGFCPTILYLYMLDNVNWETGVISNWVDSKVAIELDVPTWKVKEYRTRLKEEKYIICQRVLCGQNITVDKWKSPFGENSSERSECRSEKTPIGNIASTYSETSRLNIQQPFGENSSEPREENMSEPKPIRDLMDGITNPAFQKKEDPAARFPEDCRTVIREFIRLWKVEPLSGQLGDWIESARDLNEACKEFGLRAMQQAYQDYNENPFMVSRPGSIIKAVQAAAAKLRQSGVRTTESKVCIWCKGTGMETKQSGERHEDGRVRMVEVPCTHCGGKK